MVQPLLESKLALSSKAEAMRVPHSGESSQAEPLEKLWAACLGDTAALVETTHWEKKSPWRMEKLCLKMLVATLFVTVKQQHHHNTHTHTLTTRKSLNVP